MATRYYEVLIEFDRTDRMITLTNVYNCFHQYDNRFTFESETGYIVFNNQVKINVVQSSSNSQYFQFLNLNNSPFNNTSSRSLIGIYSHKLIITEHSFICAPIGMGSTAHGVLIFIYSKNNSNAYVTDNLGNSDTIREIDYYTDIRKVTPYGTDDTSGFSFQKLSTARLNSPYVMFSTLNVLATSGGEFCVLDDFRSCSVVSPLSTVTINNKNYLAIGTNTLVEAPSS